MLLRPTLDGRPLTANSCQVKASLQGQQEVKEEVGDEVAQDLKLREGNEAVKPEDKEDVEEEGLHAEAVKEECREEVDEEVQIPVKEKVNDVRDEKQAVLLRA